MINCKNCKADSCAQAGFDYACDHCGGYVEPTNADRIRAMSDEEMATMIRAIEFDTYTHLNPIHSTAWLLDWLKAEVDDGKSN